MGKSGALIAFLLLEMIFLASPVSAKDVPITLIASQVSYNDHSRQIEAIGGVEITYKDIRIKADTALLDQDLKMIYASGNIVVVQGEDSFQGEQFIYDIRTEHGWMAPVTTEVIDSEMKGPAFFSANRGLIRGDDLFLSGSSFTSCDLAEPHYHFTAAKVEYYPEDRIVFHKMWYWEGKYRLLYFPYFYISLKEEKENIFDVKAGYDDDTGWFLYVGYNYYLNSHNEGTIYTKITEWGGDGLGIKNATKISDKSKWYQDFYYKDNSDNDAVYDEYKLAFGYENTANPKFKIKTDAESWYYTDVEDSSYSKLALTLQGSTPYPSLTMTYTDDEDISEILYLGESWNYQTKSKLGISTNGTWYRSDYVSGSFNNSFRYYINVTKNWDWCNVALKVSNSQVFSTSSTSSQNYLPEITYSIPKWKLPWIGEVAYSGQYTNYQYLSTYNDAITSDLSGERWASNLSKSVNLWEKSSLKLYTDSKYRYRYYIIDGTASEFTGFVESLNLKKTFRKELSTTIGANYTIVDGSVPSIFESAYSDSLTGGGSITNSWAWDGPAFDASLSTGYNLTYNTINPVNISLSWSPDPKKTVSFTTIAYLEDDSYYHAGLGNTTLAAMYFLNDNLRVNLGLNIDFQDNSWGERYFEIFVARQFTQNWKGRLSARYSDVLGDFSVLDVVLTYDWHCREVQFSYDYAEAKFWVQLNFKAFPRLTISTDVDPSEFLYQ